MGILGERKLVTSSVHSETLQGTWEARAGEGRPGQGGGESGGQANMRTGFALGEA